MRSDAFRGFVKRHSLALSVLGVAVASAVVVTACGPGGDPAATEVKSIKLSFVTSAAEVRGGQKQIFTASAVDQDGNLLTSDKIVYSISPADASIATMDGGVVTAATNQTAASTPVTVTATMTGVTATVTNAVATLNVRTRVDNIVVSPSSSALTVGQTLQLVPTAAIASGSPTTGPAFTYAVTPQSAAISVSPTGVVTAIAPTPAGTPAQVVVRAEGISSTPIAITVGAAPAATTIALKVTSTPATGSLTIGSTRQYAIEVRDQFDAVMSQFTAATWISTTPGSATVSSSGLATCVAAGTTTIRAVGPNGPTGAPLTAETTLTCANAPSVATTMSIVVTSSPSTGSVFVSQTRQYAIEVRDQYSNVITPSGTPVWSFLPGTTVASISATGLATCLAPGSPNVHVVGPVNGSGANLTADATLTCAANSGNPAASIVLTPRVLTIGELANGTVSAGFLDAGGLATANGCTLGFAADASSVASVSVSGQIATVTGVNAGTTTLRAFCTAGSLAALSRLQVTKAPLNVASMLVDTHIYLPSSNATNNTFTFTAVARDGSGATVAGASVVWAIQGGNTATYSIDQTGKITVVPSVAAGFRGGGIVTATSGGQVDYGWFTYGDAGAIRGTVSSTSGQDIGPTTVTATNVSTGAVTTSPVSINGRFFLVGLQPGTYNVFVNGNAPGRSQTLNGVVVTAANTTVITVTPFP